MKKDCSELQRLNELSSFYETKDGSLNKILTTYYAALFIKERLKGKNIILMGLGDGYLAEELCKVSNNLLIVEGSEEVIKQYAKPALNYKIIHSLFEDFSPSEGFDCLIGSYVLEHVDDPCGILKKSRTWLKKNGLAIFVVPNANSLHRQIGVEMGLLSKTSDLNEQDIKLGHRRVYTINELKSQLLQTGYKVQKIQGYMIKVVSNRQMKDWSKDLLDACYKVSLNMPAELCANIAAICRNS